LLANKYYWWIDPLGALVLALYTIFEWSKTVLENAGLLYAPHLVEVFESRIICNLERNFQTWNHAVRKAHVTFLVLVRISKIFRLRVQVQPVYC
jgi:hypothetical protein